MATFVRLTRNGSIPPDTRVVKADDALALENAHEIVAAAERRAEELVEETKRQYASEKERGYADGQEQARIEHAEQIMDTIGQTVEYFGQVEGKVADVVMAALRKILGEMDQDEVVLRAVREALAVVRDQPDMTLRVSSVQVEGIRAKMDEILRGGDGVGHINVVADQRMLPGSCRLETELGVVDVSIDLQLASLEKALKSRLGRGRG